MLQTLAVAYFVLVLVVASRLVVAWRLRVVLGLVVALKGQCLTQQQVIHVQGNCGASFLMKNEVVMHWCPCRWYAFPLEAFAIYQALSSSP